MASMMRSSSTVSKFGSHPVLVRLLSQCRRVSAGIKRARPLEAKTLRRGQALAESGRTCIEI